MESDSRSGWVLGLSLVEVMLLLLFAAMMVYVADTVEGKGQDGRPIVDDARDIDGDLQARLETVMEKNSDLEKQLNEMTFLVNEVKVMVGAKGTAKESFQEAVENLRRGYAVCEKNNNNTLIEASVQHGVETVAVIGEIPSDLRVNLTKGDQTSDLEEIVSFLQDVYQYEKDRNCRFNYRLKYATDKDYRRARQAFEKYFYPEK
jgi:TolA-binding protein